MSESVVQAILATLIIVGMPLLSVWYTHRANVRMRAADRDARESQQGAMLVQRQERGE